MRRRGYSITVPRGFANVETTMILRPLYFCAKIPRYGAHNTFRAYSNTKSAPPLRILFAGSDNFSAESLKALHREAVDNPTLISSIDVLCREDGRTGRKRDVLKEGRLPPPPPAYIYIYTHGLTTRPLVPIKSLARSLDLPIHTVQNFTSFSLPDPKPHLIIAVSFGLFIPASVLASLPYGGLNVHPSLLPRYRGAAPIYHTLLQRDPETGVTIQTLSPHRFDAGDILLQSDPPIIVPPKASYATLHHQLAEVGAEMLVETLRKGLFIPPTEPVKNTYRPSLARKMTSKDARVAWDVWSAEEMERRCGMLGSVWTELGDEPEKGQRKRVILTGIAVLDNEPSLGEDIGVGCFRHLKTPGGEEKMGLKCKEGWVSVGTVKIEGRWEVEGKVWTRGLQKRGLGKRFYD
jgi:methionyl-tRNA formyltransferase